MENRCSVQINLWKCRDGFLTQTISESSTEYPCPRCNTEAFLLEAKRVAESKRLTSLGCPCCNQAGSPADYWLSALRTAQQHNMQDLPAILLNLGTITTIDHNGTSVRFRYGPDVSSSSTLAAVPRRFSCDPV